MSSAMMKAAVRRTYVDYKDLKIEEIEIPTPKSKQVLVKVMATTINRTDCAIVTGKPWIMRLFIGLHKPSTIVTGTDFAGVVESVGSEVKDYKVGDKVWGFRDEGLQSQAQYVAVGERENVAHMPEGFSFEQAAASLEAPHYAINFLNKVNITPATKVMLNGATGGIGSAALQLLKAQGAQVTAVANTPNMELIRSLGADKVYDYLKEDFLNDNDRYDFVLDAVGKSSFGKSKHLLKDEGIYVSSELGDYAENPIRAIFAPLLGKKKVLFPVPSNIKKSMSQMAKLIEQGKYQPVIDRRYSLDQISEAYEFVAAGKKTGNVILDPWS